MKRRSFMFTASLAAAVAGSIGFSAAAQAADFTWTGTTSADWNDATNWTPNDGPPASTNTVLFSGASSNTSVTISDGDAALGITFNGSTGYTIGSPTGSALNLASAGTVTAAATTAQIVNAPIVLGGTATFTNSATPVADTLVFGGSITGTADGVTTATDTLTLTGANAGANAINGVIADGTGSGTLTMVVTSTASSAPDNWILSSANTYSGGTTIENAASLEYTNVAALGSGTITIAGGGAATALVAGVTGTLTNNITVSGAEYSDYNTFNTNGFTTTLTGKITGTNTALVISGTGTLILSAAGNSIAGNGTFVTGGATLELGSGGTFSPAALTLTNGTFNTGTAATQGVGGFAGGASSTLDLGTTNFTDTRNQTAQTTAETYSGSIVGSGNFTVHGNGTTVLNNNVGGLASFSGVLGIQDNTIITVSAASGLNGNSVAFVGGYYSGESKATTEALEFTGGSVALGSVSMARDSSSTFTGAITNTIDAGTYTVTITGPVSSTNAFENLVLQNGNFVLSGGIGNGSTATTVVQVGSTTTTGALSNINFTIGAEGSLSGGVLSSSSTAAGTVTWNLNGDSGDLLTDDGTLNITNLNLVVNMSGTQTLTQYTLVNYTGGTLTGSAFASVSGLAPGWTINYDLGNSIVIEATPVPEPASLGLLGLGGLMLLARRRRRVSQA